MVCAAGRFVIGLALLFVCVLLLSFWRYGRLAWGEGGGLVFVLVVHLFFGCAHVGLCHFFSLPPGVGGWQRLLLVTLPGMFCLPFLYGVKGTSLRWFESYLSN